MLYLVYINLTIILRLPGSSRVFSFLFFIFTEVLQKMLLDQE